MKKGTQPEINFTENINPKNFIHLKEKILGEYIFIYHINDGYSIKNLSKFEYKEQLLFQKIENKRQQHNLMLIDSKFPIILADIVLEVFINDIENFTQYECTQCLIFPIDREFDKHYIKYKIKYFIQHLLYRNIGQLDNTANVLDLDKIFYRQNDLKEMEYFSVYEFEKLEELLFGNIRLEVDKKLSKVKNDNVNLRFRLVVD